MQNWMQAPYKTPESNKFSLIVNQRCHLSARAGNCKQRPPFPSSRRSYASLGREKSLCNDCMDKLPLLLLVDHASSSPDRSSIHDSGQCRLVVRDTPLDNVSGPPPHRCEDTPYKCREAASQRVGPTLISQLVVRWSQGIKSCS